MSESGPTQGAERHAQKVQGSWTGRPWAARALRVAIFLLPLLVSFGFSIIAGRVLPAEKLGINRWLWIAIVFVLANVLLIVLRRLADRFVPLVALMKLTLVFPDSAPSRTKAALRQSNSKTMLREMREAQARGETTGEAMNGDYLVQLLKEVNEHDRLTRGHSERVRAYAELIGKEIGLKADEMNKLRWAALLHDVGKLSVPREILNKKGRPDDREWQILSGHPAAGIPLLEPLRDWLGDWIHAADQHHCRWDGKGYPSDLAGTNIALSGRIVAIADAYDVMTSARSYKKPLSSEIARQELTDCAGSQFDPMLVRAFLRIGLGRLRAITGPFAWLANLTGSAQLPLPAANAVSTGVVSTGVAATGAVTVAVGSMLAPTPAPQGLALDEPIVVVDDVVVNAVAGEATDVLLSARGSGLTFTIGGAVHGAVDLVSFPQLIDSEAKRWQATARYTPADNYIGEDGFSFEACDGEGNCDQGTALLQLAAPAVVPTTAPSTTAPSTTESTTTSTTSPPTTAPPTTARPTTAPPTTTAPTTTTTAPTTTAPTTTAPTTTAPAEENFGPIVQDDTTEIDEDQVLVILVLNNDSDPEGASLAITGVGAPIHGTALVVGDGIRYEPPADFVGNDQFTYTVSDGVNPDAVGTVSVAVRPVNDPPQFSVPDATIAETASIGTAVATVTVEDPDDVAFTFELDGDPTNRFSIGTDGIVRVAQPLDHENTLVHNVIIRVSDGDVTTLGTLRVEVADVDEPPEVGDDTTTTTEDTSVSVDVSTNDADPEGQALTFVVPTVSEQGGAVSAAGGVATYTPPLDFVGTDTFAYEAKDPAGNTSVSATVTIVVEPENDAPVARDDGGVGYTTNEDSAFTTADVRANDSDADDPVGDLTIVVTRTVSFGTLVNNGDGDFDYEPDPDAFGVDSFEYELIDASGARSAPATVTISVTPINDAPSAMPDTLSVNHNGAANTVDLRLNDVDVDGDDLTVISVTDGTSGTVTLNANGTATYTHDGSTTTSDSFTYTVRDDAGATDNGTVTVTITPMPDFDGVGAGDNCPSAYNPTQIDTDRDGIGDECDPSPTASTGGSIGASASLGSDKSQAVGAADFDGDGDPDLVFANLDEPNTIVRNGVLGLFDTGQELADANTRNVAIGDIDGDGDFDLVFADGNDDNTVWFNDGSGNFSAGTAMAEAKDAWDVALGDVDADGDLDAVFANNGDGNTVWLNDGTGSFSTSGQTLGGSSTKGVSIGDLDGDSFLDLSFSNDGEADTVWFNDGSGVFTNSGQSLGVVNGRSHANELADLDGDGDLDIAIAGDNDFDSVWFNDGSGVFTQTGPMIGLGHSRALDIGDVDGDGDLDIVFGDHSGPSSLWLNDGNGSFSDSGERTGNDATEGILLIDTDGDGDLGLLEANDSDNNRIYQIS